MKASYTICYNFTHSSWLKSRHGLFLWKSWSFSSFSKVFILEMPSYQKIPTPQAYCPWGGGMNVIPLNCGHRNPFHTKIFKLDQPNLASLGLYLVQRCLIIDLKTASTIKWSYQYWVFLAVFDLLSKQHNSFHNHI